MTSITQKIPNLIGGISQQPDELIPLGSVKDALNVIPDVTDGLRKRSGSRLVNPLLTNPQGSWFHYNYSDNQKYIGKVNYDGTVHVFNCADGLPCDVSYRKWEYTPEDQSEPPFPQCDQAATQAAKIAWQSKVDEYNVANNQYSNLVVEQDAQVKEETSTRFRVEVDEQIFKPTYYVYEGDVKMSGPDYRRPATPQEAGLSDDWKRRRGDVGVAPNGKKLDGVSVNILRESSTGETAWQLVNDVTVYENVFYRAVEVDTDLDQEVDEKRAEVDTLRAEVNTLYAAYVAEAAKCGYVPEQNITRDIVESDVAPDYLKHGLPMQIKPLIVGDTIFFTNPEVATSMEPDSAIPARPSENFVELLSIAPNKVYTLELIDETTQGSSYTRVTKVSVVNGQYQDSDSSCGLVGSKRETFNSGNKVNLDITLTVTGSQFLAGNGNSLSDYECKYISTAQVNNGGANWEVGDIVTMEIADRDYDIRVEEVETFYSSKGQYIFPPQTSNGAEQVIKANEILDGIRTAIAAVDGGFQTEIIGNGLYITHADSNYTFTFATPEAQLMNVVTSEVNNISDLPKQCKGGYVVKIANTDSEYDDYWAKFTTEYSGMDGTGAWEETVAPGYATVINAASMPHKMVRTQSGKFIVSPISWEPRLVGDNKTNPKPSFLSRPLIDGDRFINKMAFFRNRLCMLSGDNVICSRPGDYYNFWKGSALQLVDNDPIDIAVGSTSSSANATLLDAIEIPEGLLTFTEAEQHVLSTDSEVFGPTTARFSRIGTYRFNGQVSKFFTNPDGSVEGVVRGAYAFSMGNSVGFLSDAGLNSKMMEIYNIGRAAEPSANELSKPVTRLIPFGINTIAESKDNNLIALARRGTKDVYVYRYFDNDQQRQQSAWFRWQMLGKMMYHCIMDDVYWYVSRANTSSQGVPEDQRQIVSLQRIDLKDELATAFVQDKYLESAIAGAPDAREEVFTGQPYQIHMDNYRIAQPSEFTYYTHLDQTYFRAPLAYYKDEADKGNLVAYMLSPTQFQRESPEYGEGQAYYFVKIGSSIPIRVEEDRLGTWFVMDGDWSKTRMMIGYQFKMKVSLPTLYPTKSSATLTGTSTRSDTRGDLTLHRLKINFGQVGVCQTRVITPGKNEYRDEFESTIPDRYPANEIAFQQSRTQTLPLYCKNKDTRIIIETFDPSPCTIDSVEWEGNYTEKYYKRV